MPRRSAKDKPRYPKIPVARLIKRGHDLVFACKRDREDLEKAGISWDSVEELSRLLDECSEMESQLAFGRQKCKTGTEALEDFTKQCRALRSSIIQSFNYLNKCSLPGAGSKFRFKREGSRAGIVQELYDLYRVCGIYEKELSGIGFDFELAQEAYRKSNELSRLISITVLEREDLAYLVQKAQYPLQADIAIHSTYM